MTTNTTTFSAKDAKKALKKVKKMSFDECVKFIDDNDLDVGLDGDYEDLSEKDLRVILTDELEDIIDSDLEDDADLEEEENEEEEIKEEPKKEKPVKAKKEKVVKEKPATIKKEKDVKDPNKQPVPKSKLEKGEVIELTDEGGDAHNCYLLISNKNYPILKSDVCVDLMINDNELKAFDDGSYITACILGNWFEIKKKYINLDVNYKASSPVESAKVFVDMLNNGEQEESDYTFVEKQVSAKPAKKTITKVDVADKPVEEAKKEVKKEIKKAKISKEAKPAKKVKKSNK